MKISDLTEGYWKNVDIANKEGLPVKPKKPELPRKFHVLINGRVWKKNGEVVSFTTHENAQKSADTIMNRYGKATQVVEV